MESIKTAVKKTPLARVFIYAKSLVTKPRAQNDESIILHRLLRRYLVPQTFIEFGFSGWEFNCADLAKTWRGLLVDGDSYNIRIAKTLFGQNITAESCWLTLDTLSVMKSWAEGQDIGILSVDVDGNDYWFLQELMYLKPAIVIAEYNSSFGLQPITVPYDPKFDRTLKHPTHTYFGASLSALNHLLTRESYSLIEIGNTGVNAFFVRNDLLTGDDLVLQPETAFREKFFFDGSRPSGQWAKIESMEYVDVTKLP